jgi:uncharacterized 2Fe-2S/4Fe-4S cluster protein (DUF4445 family)
VAKIHLLNEKKIIECESGTNIYEILSYKGFMDAPCGGTGLCGKCQVRIDNHEVIPCDDTQAAFFTPEQIEAGWRLACLCEVTTDMTVELPPKPKISNIVSQGYMKEFVHAPGPLISADGGMVLPSGNKSAAVSAAARSENCYGIAVDIGTTTVIASLVHLNTGQEIESLACLNGQKAFGQDVISRIHYASTNSRGTEILQKTISKDLRTLITELCQRHNLTADDVYDMSVAANTTMIHLLAGINPASMGRTPYVPAFQGELSLNGRKLGLPVSSHCNVYCLPVVSAFVGGDITGGVLACGLENQREKTLFIDIGTNGEIVLADGERFCSCSCAAGPALEGMNITCGVRAEQGAIEDVYIDGNTVQYTTIGGGTATGICGSGLLAAIAEMRRAGIINKSGRLQSHPLVETVAGKKRFIVDARHHIYLTQQDIRQVQLAKGAIRSGIYALLEAVDWQVAEVQRVIVAGQFGAHLKADSLIGSGILPAEWREIITYAGNTSKSGALICLLSQPERELVENLAKNIQYIELAELTDYESLFIKCMQF